jgi:alpha-glucosidase
MGPVMQHCGERRLDPLTLEIYPGHDRSFTLYEDDGESNAYQNGAYAQTLFEVSAGASAPSCAIGEVRGGYAGYRAEREVVLNIHHQSAVAEVTLDGAPLCAGSPEQAGAGWWWNEAARLLTVRFRRSAKSSIVQVR